MSEWAEGFDVAWLQMRRAGTCFRTPATGLREACLLVESVLEGASWGQDQYGQQFAAGFARTLQGLSTGCEEGAKAIDDLEERVDTSSRNYERAGHLYRRD
jgi:hypothetical protein